MPPGNITEMTATSARPWRRGLDGVDPAKCGRSIGPASQHVQLGIWPVRSHFSGMSADQNQHYLPQSYQRGWIDASGRPHVYRWAYNKLVCEPKATKSTGGRDGLYFIPMAPPGEQNTMEEAFWKKIDQWGADGLALLRTNDPSAAARINKDRLATFVMSFLFRSEQGQILQRLGQRERPKRMPQGRLRQISKAARARHV